MNKIILFLLVIISTTSMSQVISYEDGAVLFSNENIKGTARFTGMSGAFGALGGDLSAIEINPAGLAVFNNPETAITLDNNSISTKSNYYNTTTNSSEDIFGLSQAGAIMIFENEYENWFKFSLGVNFSIVNDFDNSYNTIGTSPVSDFNQDPFLNFDTIDDNDVFYENVDNQTFYNYTSGTNEKFTVSIAAQYDEKTYFGIAINSHSIDYFQKIIFNENNNDGNGNTLHARLQQNLLVRGEGININLGIITKPIKNLRLGLAYQTPTWYDLTEEFQENTTIDLSNTNSVFHEDSSVSVFDYQIRTPSRITASAAYIFNKKGLISFDYAYKNFNNIKLKPNSQFSEDNNNLKNNLEGISEIRIGAEYRYKIYSFRAGYHMEENPVKEIDTNENGYSFGLGIKFSDLIKLDFSYDNTTSKENYNFLNYTNPTELDFTKERVTVTFTLSI